MKKIYIGVVGQIAAGKEVLAEYLIEKYGFATFSLSTVLHRELEKKGIQDFTRKTLQDMGDELRKTVGDDALARKTMEIIEKEKKPVVITGIRNPAEVKYFKTVPNFILIAVKAKKKIRYRRVLRRAKPWDPQTWKDFYQIDRRDYGIGQDKSGQQVGVCIRLANFTLTNNKDKKSFYNKVEKIVKKIVNL